VDPKSAEIVIVGGGQAGLALSYHLTALGRAHVVLEQGRTVESWRRQRWDSLRLIAPNWSLVLPGFAYRGDDPEGFMGKDEVVDRLVGYGRTFGAPVHEGVRIVSVDRDPLDTRFVLRTEGGQIEAATIVLATGALQRPRVPEFAEAISAGIVQLVPAEYRNPAALPSGAVLVVGSGETGCQIAEELARAGRDVFLSVGRSWWAPRRYRGRDIAAWMRLVGWFDRLAADLPRGAHAGRSNPQLTGADGGHDINPHSLARDGVTLLGRLLGVRHDRAYLADDLWANVTWGDEQARRFLRCIDRVVVDYELEAPAAEVPDVLNRAQRDETMLDGRQNGLPPTELDLSTAGISTLIWATGYQPDLSWVHLPFLDADGYPVQRRGVTTVPG
jgi:putative flavoprotein involved in K+ transport